MENTTQNVINIDTNSHIEGNRQVLQSLENNTQDVGKLKEKLTQMFLNALGEAHTIEQLAVVEKFIKPLEPYIKNVCTPSCPLTNHDGEIKTTSSKVDKQKRIFESTIKRKKKGSNKEN